MRTSYDRKLVASHPTALGDLAITQNPVAQAKRSQLPNDSGSEEKISILLHICERVSLLPHRVDFTHLLEFLQSDMKLGWILGRHVLVPR